MLGGGIVMSIGVLKLGDYAFAWNLNFDTLGFSDTAFVAPATALNFFLGGSALLLAASSRAFGLFQVFALIVGLLGWLGFAAYLLGGEQLPPLAQMAVHTSLLFLLLSAGILCLRTDGGLMALLASGTVGGRVALWLLLLAPPLPLLIDALENRAQAGRWLGAASPTPLFAVLDTILLGALIWVAGLWVQRIEVRRSDAEARHRANAAQLRLFVEHAPAAIAMVDQDMRYIAVSRRWLTDYRLDAVDVIGRSHYEIFPEIPQPWKDMHQRCLAGAVEKSEEDSFQRGDGRVDWVRWEIHPWHRSDGEIGGIIFFSEVITERIQAAERIRRLNRVYAMLSQINSLIVRVHDTRVLYEEACRIAVELGNFGVAWIGTFNAATTKLEIAASAGLEPGDPLLRKIDIRKGSPQEHSLPAQALRKRHPIYDNALGEGRISENERYKEILRRGYRSVIALPLIVDGFVTGIISMWAEESKFFDDEELKLLTELANDISFALGYLTKQEELDYLSYYDVLTGLPNRSLFLDRLGQQLRIRGSDSRKTALLLFDLERFRTINETLGRHGGDELLRSVGQRLKRACGGHDNLARVGANSFALVVRGARDPAELVHAMENNVLSCFKEPYAVYRTELRISAKVGLALFPEDGRDADILFRNAEAALKETKSSGSRYLFYAAEMNAQAAKALTLETRLRKAVDAKEFVLHYQPKVRLDSRRLCGLEALIRWQHPETGLIPPAEFIPMLEETGLIVEVGHWAMEQALKDYSQWIAKGIKVPRIAVNVSAAQLRQDDFLAGVIDLVQAPDTVPEALELELTESLFMQDIESNFRTFSILRGMDVHIAMDDFGTGYSSLRYLARLPIDKIKIDRSFISGMIGNNQDRIVVSTIITLAHSFGLPVVAEGVETEEQAQALVRLECDEAQGYLFSAARPAAEIGDLLAASS
jgi:diguanylate cyclase (GGDEF)-like protein/PAS domain S-box-containing protein